MSDLKTKPNDNDVHTFVEQIKNEQKREDSKALLRIMQDITGETPMMWGPSIIGFGKYHYKYESGREGNWFLTGFSPRKQNMTVYIMSGFSRYEQLLKKLGKYTTGKSCLYFKKLADVDQKVFEKLIKLSVAHLKEKYS